MTTRRTLLKSLAATGLLGPAGIAGLIQQALADDRKPIAAGMRNVRGDVRVNGRPAIAGQLIGPGDTVSTGPSGEAIYVIGKDAFLQREDSTVGFAAEGAKKLMRVVTGRILSVFGQGEMTIKVSTATVGIRGTACYIEDEPEGPRGVGKGGSAAARTYFCLCYGSVDLTPGAAPNEREQYTTTHHDKPLYIYNDMTMPKMTVPAGVINHTDIELTMLEALVGRLTPYNGTDSSY